MRFLISKYAVCMDHPRAPLEGCQNGDIQCRSCGLVLGRWNVPWSPQWVLATEDVMGRQIARWLPRSVVKWALSRATTHATEGRWCNPGTLEAYTISATEVSRRWEIA